MTTATATRSEATFWRTVHAEWIKIRSVRSTMFTLLFMAILGVGISSLGALAVRAATNSGHLHHAINPVTHSLGGTLIAQIAIGVLGVLVFTGEISSGTLQSTFAAVPQRWKVLLAKVLVYFIIALIASEIVAFACFFAGQAIMSGVVTTANLSDPGVLRAVAGTGLYLPVIGVLALAIGVMIRRTAGAITAFVGIYLVLPLLVSALPSPYSTDIDKFLPFQVSQTMLSNVPVPGSLSPWTGFFVVVAYTVILIIIAGSLLKARDA